MAEQYLSAFAVDPAALTAVVGSGDRSVVAAASAALPDLKAAGALLRATDAEEVERALTEIVTGRLDPRRPGGYTWTLEVLAPTVGRALGGATLPGRGWDGLARVFAAWDLPALAGFWGAHWPFPWEADDRPDVDPWPVASLATDLAGLQAELADVDTDRAYDDPALLPSGDEDDAEEIAWLLDDRLPEWVSAARSAGRSLLVVRDGGR